ncbi:hypothetical protein ZWY2020_055374 [Hordeum vulgare]|nr:hypothetical protein ZWY2020_055374 [Hordeum vulgare]
MASAEGQPQEADARVLLHPQHRLHQPAHLQGHRCVGGPRPCCRRQAGLLAAPKVPRLPSQGICEAPHASPSRLRSLNLRGCALLSPHGHAALTVLVLQDTPMSTPESAYAGISPRARSCRCFTSSPASAGIGRSS